METRLKIEYVEKIKRDPEIHGKIAKLLKLGPNSLAIPLRKNSNKLIQINVLRLLSDYYGVNMNDLLEEVEEPETENV